MDDAWPDSARERTDGMVLTFCSTVVITLPKEALSTNHSKVVADKFCTLPSLPVWSNVGPAYCFPAEVTLSSRHSLVRRDITLFDERVPQGFNCDQLKLYILPKLTGLLGRLTALQIGQAPNMNEVGLGMFR